MSASEASLYKAVGSFDLSGQSTPLTVSNADIELGSEVLAFLKTERGTVSGVSIQNIQQGSFQAVFNTANDSIYSYYCVPPVYKFHADNNPINPVNPNQRTINFVGNSSTTPSSLALNEFFVAGSYSIGAGKTCTSSSCIVNIQVQRNSLGVGIGFVELAMTEGGVDVETKQYTVPAGNGLYTITDTWVLNSSLYSTTGSSRTFNLVITNAIPNTSGSASVVLYDGGVPLSSSLALTANYS